MASHTSNPRSKRFDSAQQTAPVVVAAMAALAIHQSNDRLSTLLYLAMQHTAISAAQGSHAVAHELMFGPGLDKRRAAEII
jgi:hypothetical protein